MSTPTGLNKNSSAVKRIMSEARELQNDDSSEYAAGPLEGDIFEWHCTIRGPADTEFEGGLYHCRIILPSEYPFKAPSIMVLTPNGRFELNKKICISFTSYHEELWQPAWGVRTVMIGLQGFFPLKGEAAVGVGAVEFPIAERKRLAALSRSWTCPDCGLSNHELLPDPPVKDASTSEAVVVEEGSAEQTSPVVPTSQESSTPAASSAPAPMPSEPTLIPPQAPTAESSATRTPPSPTPTPAPIALELEPVLTAIKTRPPLWLDMSIVVFSFLVVYLAGKRLTNLWDVVSEYV